MNCCKRCGKPLVNNRTVHAMQGDLFCSKTCAIMSASQYIIENSMQAAEAMYNDLAEEVDAASILGEDMRIVQFMRTTVGVIAVPKILSDEEALAQADKLYSCEDYEDYTITSDNVEFTLVDNNNSVD